MRDEFHPDWNYTIHPIRCRQSVRARIWHAERVLRLVEMRGRLGLVMVVEGAVEAGHAADGGGRRIPGQLSDEMLDLAWPTDDEARMKSGSSRVIGCSFRSLDQARVASVSQRSAGLVRFRSGAMRISQREIPTIALEAGEDAARSS